MSFEGLYHSYLQPWPHNQVYVAPPKEGTKFQVVCCGLPRSGTTSVGMAMAILLDGPVADGGSTARLGTTDRQKLMVDMMTRGNHVPIKNDGDKQYIKDRLFELTNGYVATTDAPGCYFVEELLELYPDAKFVCTIRDRDGWWKSYQGLVKRTSRLYDLAWTSSRVWRYTQYCSGVWNQIPQCLGINARAGSLPTHAQLYDAHAAYVRRSVPKDRLLLFDVRDGWKPLCEFLNVPVPDLPFPRANDRKYHTSQGDATRAALKRRAAIIVSSLSLCVAVVARTAYSYSGLYSGLLEEHFPKMMALIK